MVHVMTKTNNKIVVTLFIYLFEFYFLFNTFFQLMKIIFWKKESITVMFNSD